MSKWIAGGHGRTCLVGALLMAAAHVHAGAGAKPPQGDEGATLVAAPLAGLAAVDPRHITMRIDEDRPFHAQGWRVQCDGKQLRARDVPATGIVGWDVAGTGKVLKFGRATVPDAERTRALLLRAQPNNLHVGGAPRCEVGFKDKGNALPRGKVVWHAWSMWIADWHTAGDRMAIAQWYHGMPGASLNPPMVIDLKAGELSVTLRHSTKTGVMQQADQVSQRVLRLRDPTLFGRWVDFVIQARISPFAEDGGFFRLWVDDQLLVDHHGPVGYAADGAVEGPVLGIYPLIKGATPFDLSQPVRDVYLRRALVVRDAALAYTAADVRGALHE